MVVNETTQVNITPPDPYLYNQDLRFVFSKDTDNLPITRTELSSGLPCVSDPGFRTQKNNKQKLEIERDVYSIC